MARFGGRSVAGYEGDLMAANTEEEKDELLRQIGQLKVETDWLKKKWGILHSRRKGGSST